MKENSLLYGVEKRKCLDACFLRENIPVLKLYLERELRHRSEISAQLESASGDAAKKRRMEVEEEKQFDFDCFKTI